MIQEGDINYPNNKKELQDELGLNWYDYGARFYDPSLGRFHTLDPLAESYYLQSSYVYAMNNPILLIDWMGMGPDSTNQSSDFTIEFGDDGDVIITDEEGLQSILMGSGNNNLTTFQESSNSTELELELPGGIKMDGNGDWDPIETASNPDDKHIDATFGSLFGLLSETGEKIHANRLHQNQEKQVDNMYQGDTLEDKIYSTRTGYVYKDIIKDTLSPIGYESFGTSTKHKKH